MTCSTHKGHRGSFVGDGMPRRESGIWVWHFGNDLDPIIHGHDIGFVVEAIATLYYIDAVARLRRSSRDACELADVKVNASLISLVLFVDDEATARVHEEIWAGIPVDVELCIATFYRVSVAYAGAEAMA